MGVRRDHQMATDVGITIEDYEVVSAAIEDEVPGVFVWVRLRLAKDASAILDFVRTGVGDVLVSPRAPQSFHDRTLPDECPACLLPSFVYQFLQFLAGFEIGDAFSRNVHGLASFRIPAAASAALANTNAATP